MSNDSIIARMDDCCAEWDAGAIDCLELGERIVGLSCALEGVPDRIRQEALGWEGELVAASDPANFGQSDLATVQVIAVVSRIRQWVESGRGDCSS